jgi:2-amino-4-hydroxy-6-hydroxymethyldihydropteridine diphosphokinase
VVGVGANLGEPAATVAAALARLPGVVATSDLYRTAPIGGPEQPDFVNAAALLDVPEEPRALLALLHAIERDAGRVRDVRWGPRTLDLDILVWDGPAVASDDLTIPHPRLPDRLFAILPLLDVHPGELADGRSLRAIAATLDQQVLRLASPDTGSIEPTTATEG